MSNLNFHKRSTLIS